MSQPANPATSHDDSATLAELSSYGEPVESESGPYEYNVWELRARLDSAVRTATTAIEEAGLLRDEVALLRTATAPHLPETVPDPGPPQVADVWGSGDPGDRRLFVYAPFREAADDECPWWVVDAEDDPMDWDYCADADLPQGIQLLVRDGQAPAVTEFPFTAGERVVLSDRPDLAPGTVTAVHPGPGYVDVDWDDQDGVVQTPVGDLDPLEAPAADQAGG